MWIPSLQEFSADKILDFLQSRMPTDDALSWAHDIFLAVLIALLFWGLSRLLTYLLTKWGPRLTAVTRTNLDDRMMHRVTPPLGLLIFFAGIYLAVRSLPLSDGVRLAVSGVVFIVNVGIFGNIAYRCADEFLCWYARRVEERTGAGMGTQVLPLIRKVFMIFLVCAALIVILKHFRYDILSLVTALGIGSLAIGMAAKDTLANMISGFTLMIDRPFRIGDRIQLAGGKTGDVIDVGLRSTKIKTPENTLLIIPNSELCNSTVLNMAFPDTRSQGRINVGVAYGTDIEEVKKILVSTASGEEDVLKDPAPEALFLSFGENSLNMSLFYWVSDYTKLVPTTDRINSKILERFSSNGIQIPYPTRRVVLEREA